MFGLINSSRSAQSNLKREREESSLPATGGCIQGSSEGTSSVAFEVVIINCQIYFINLFIFNCLTFRILELLGKMMTSYLPDIYKFLRYRTLWKSILKCRFPAKGIELTRFVLFEILGVPQL